MTVSALHPGFFLFLFSSAEPIARGVSGRLHSVVSTLLG